MIVSNEVETVRKEAVIYTFEVLPRKLHRETEWSRGRYQESACPRPIFELGTFLIQVKKHYSFKQTCSVFVFESRLLDPSFKVLPVTVDDDMPIAS